MTGSSLPLLFVALALLFLILSGPRFGANSGPNPIGDHTAVLFEILIVFILCHMIGLIP